MNAIAPGKVILSGEHSVVYGAPAIALAIDNHVRASFKPDAGGRLGIAIGAAEPAFMACTRLAALAAELDRRFVRFAAGELPVTALLDTPSQLLFYVLAAQGVSVPGILTTTSTLPTGAGMGSSAAAIAATLLIAERLAAKPLSLAQRFQRVRHCERLQHGRGSAIDAAAVTFGGMVQVQQDQVAALPLRLGPGWFRVDTGRPEVSTGQCVQAVREAFADSAIWNEFAALTARLPQALQQDAALIGLLRDNQRLLERIGVVPAPVQKFIRAVEAAGGAAKVSGAGAHRGTAGGLVLAYLPQTELEVLCARFGYGWAALQEDRQGARILNP